MSLIVETDGALGHITLNKPKALHALDLPMCEGMTDALKRWQNDPKIGAVVVDHLAGTRGFCSGGDIRLLSESAASDGVAARNFFRTEYRLNTLIHEYPKPYIALIDGITMGGGVGISVHGAYRVATENTTFAMPETGIGLFPDVGGGWFLPRLPGEIGLWLALTGARLKAADCVEAGIATHYVPSAELPALKAALAEAAEKGNIKDALDAAHKDPGPAPLKAQREKIDRIFSAATVETIVAMLEQDGSDWAKAQIATLATKSPQTMKVALRQLREGAKMTRFLDTMVMEFRIASRVVMRPDFREGVRATIVEKDNAPKWNPATLADVTDALLDEIFAPLPAHEEFTL
jgi:enoyl-CoA hydratase